ncbi:hypothetical protein M2333_001545 [Sphingobium sp. B11D3B]|uniref:SapC family protein n=1 Tax=Sphingobium sp. B11D3B TaxID=2940575 RepID=UPI0022267107|nr:SapC family protein [Sphingobium sp. B11D3B]MCW2388499.1 hypothetical protein [Sphingobium sp. B11D3B]
MEAALEILDSQAHRHLRLGAISPETRNFVPVLPSEFAAAAAVCPILFAKNPETGAFYVGVLFGFKEGENLLVDSHAGKAPFRSLDEQREAFFVSGENIAIDRASPRLSEVSGEPLFDEDGGATSTTRHMQRLLGQIVAGQQEAERFIATLNRLGIIQPIDISLRFDDGETIELAGLYTVSLDRLHDLDDASVLALFRNGDLQLAYCVAASLKQVPVLAERRNQMLTRAG